MDRRDRRERLARARLYVVTGARQGHGDLAEFLDAVLETGADMVQLREKSAEAGDLLRWGATFRDAAERHDVLFIVNDRPDVAVALDADVRNSTYSENFLHDAALQERFFECRIAEQNMLSCAGGLAAGGKLPFVSTFGKFLERGYDQIEMGLMSGFPLKLVGSHVGVSLAADGPSQMALPDVAFFRAWTTLRSHAGKPLLYLLQPADAYAAYALTVAMAAHEGPCYLRTLRPDVPFLYNDTTAFALGGHHVLAEGHDLCIVAAGYMVHEAHKALPLLKEQGIEATLVDLYSLPFDDVAILQLVQENQGQVLTVEDNYGAGMGSAVADALAAHGGAYTLMQMYVRQIPKSGRTPDDVLRSLHLSAPDIVQTAVRMLDVAAR